MVKYCDVAKVTPATLKRVATPFIDEKSLSLEDVKTTGILAKEASTVVLKCLYCARACRWDLLGAVCSLATEVDKWSRARDRKLLRLISYMHCTPELTLECFIGDKPENIKLVCFSDADHASHPGCRGTHSTAIGSAAH